MKEKICKVTDITHDQWLDFRRTGIGGSDAAAILGLNTYSSPYLLYCDKLGELAPKETSEAMRLGHDLEQYVADRWMEKTGKRCQKNNFMWRSVEHPFMLADIDREIVGENAGLECKTTSVFSRYDWENGEYPDNYYCQCMHYMAVMGFDKMYLAVAVLGKGVYCYEIERREDEIAALVEQEQEFWNHVETHTPPELDGSEADMEALRQKYPNSDSSLATVVLPAKSDKLLNYMSLCNEQIKALKKEADKCKAELIKEIGDAETARSEKWAVSWKSQNRPTVDSKKLKIEYPQIYEACTKVSSTRVFRTKKLTEE